MISLDAAIDEVSTDCAPPYCSFIDGDRRESSEEGVSSSIDVIDPSTGRSFGSASLADQTAIVNEAVESSARAFASDDWSQLSNGERAALLRNLGALIVENAERIARLETLACGKPLRATIGEIRAAKIWYDYYANAIELDEGLTRQVSRSIDAQIIYEPLGPVVAITPYNAAFSLGSWKLAPAIAAGNTVILKPPPTAPGSSIVLAQLALEAGFPKGVINVVVGGKDAGTELVRHANTAMVTFTGSTPVARDLGSLALSFMKRFVCEAGGKSAHIVFDDGDVESAVIAATQGVFSAAGQTCVAGSRVLVHASLYEAFVEQFRQSAERLVVGNPFHDATHVGPIGSKNQLDRIRGYVERAIAAGGGIVTGGVVPDVSEELRNGFWYAPTIITGLPVDAEICNEEVFGPVAVVVPFETEDEAISIANSVDYGLAAGFWTRDLHRAKRVCRRLQAGTVWLNCYRAINVFSPFGGYKQSGIGRENGIEALQEFRQVKSIVSDFGKAVDQFAY